MINSSHLYHNLQSPITLLHSAINKCYLSLDHCEILYNPSHREEKWFKDKGQGRWQRSLPAFQAAVKKFQWFYGILYRDVELLCKIYWLLIFYRFLIFSSFFEFLNAWKQQQQSSTAAPLRQYSWIGWVVCLDYAAAAVTLAENFLIAVVSSLLGNWHTCRHGITSRH